ncbi:prolyl oligopeptidase family serine peptidase [Nitrospirillum amazonense]|uniref:S9 family peptidase n=1 Tax=Nitrospirillum amazonense TaxID=28077 RepID=UPI002DD42D50|nr:prolyl oligopeptidase family serine peptidase [Nitrospirillum amazonense]MEC4593229.1 prolyl oligopeptidase family serine peptidase [Nitrospirillum amazonense]
MGLRRAAVAALLMGLVTGMTDATAAEKKTAAYGTWASPITAARLAGSEIRLGDLMVDGGVPYWLESRPAEKGRYAVVTPDGAGGFRELTGPEVNARTRVHEYGGGALLAVGGGLAGGRLYFSNFADQRLYTVPEAGGAPQPLTPEGYRYADCVAGAPGHLYCVREDHSAPGEAKNTIVSLAVDTPGDAGTVLFGGTDFVAYPRPSPDGKRLAWIAWSHPNMPWDTTTLYVADITPQGLGSPTAVAGGHDESVLEPQWDADGTLYFISDRSDWWNLYAWHDGATRPVLAKAAEFGGPLWNLGLTTYALTGRGQAVARYSSQGLDRLAVIDLKTGNAHDLDLPFVGITGVRLLGPDQAVMIASFADATPAVVTVNLATGTHAVLRRPAPEGLEAGLVSRARPIEFPTAPGPDGQARTAHAFYYAPTNPAFQAPAGEKPPLLVKVHGGPTSAAKPSMDMSVQYWTSRGFAVVDVNYGGSTGYGRAYRNRLRGNWGITDVQDATAVVAYLDKAGLADANRAAIRGGSAGGYTTLAALALTKVFKAGANYYGVSDMESLAKDTHKFESRYLDSLVAPYPAGKAVYDARSPLHHLDGFSAPLITFQGSEDAVVPPAQSRSIVNALKAKGVPVAYIEFEGEQHGFRKADSIIRAQEAELYFYGRIFGFTPADTLPGVAIDNLK